MTNPIETYQKLARMVNADLPNLNDSVENLYKYNVHHAWIDDLAIERGISTWLSDSSVDCIYDKDNALIDNGGSISEKFKNHPSRVEAVTYARALAVIKFEESKNVFKMG